MIYCIRDNKSLQIKNKAPEISNNARSLLIMLFLIEENIETK
jgi:hypothetical protein